MIDFNALTDEQRLQLVEVTLGLLPSENDWKGRALFLAFEIANGSPAEHVHDALEQLEEVRPGWFKERALRFAWDKGYRLPELETTDA